MWPLKKNGSKNTHSNVLHGTEISILNLRMGFMCTIFLENKNNFAQKKKNKAEVHNG